MSNDLKNMGLKPYAKQLTQTVGNAGEVSINLSKAAANLIMTLPLFSTVGDNPINLSLIFNYQNRNEDGIFGKGFKLNYFSKLEITGSYTITNADGSEDVYEKNEIKNKETGGYIIEQYEDDVLNYIELYDKHDNYVGYKDGGVSYPSYICSKKNGTIIINMVEGLYNITNGKGDEVKFIFTNGYVTECQYFHNNDKLYKCGFNYENGYLKSIIVYRNKNVYSQTETFVEFQKSTISISGQSIKLEDDISKYATSYQFESDQVRSFTDSYNGVNDATTTISYGENITTVTDSKEKKAYFIFDSNGFLLYEADDDLNVIKTEFDKESKALLYQSSVIPTKNVLTNIFPGPGINYFTNNGLSVSKYEMQAGTIEYDILGSSAYKVTGTGSLSFGVDVDGLGSDSTTLVLFGKQLTKYTETSNVEVSLTAGGSVRKTIKNDKADSNFNLIMLGTKAFSTYKRVEVTITLKGNAEIILGGLQVLKKDFGAFYEYDGNGNNVNKETGYSSVQSAYNNYNFVSSIVGANSAASNFKYDNKGNVTEGDTAYGVNVVNKYDLNNHLLSEKLNNPSTNEKIETTKAYDTNGNITSETDSLGNSTTYTYDSFGNLAQVTNALSEVVKYEYNQYGCLKTINLSQPQQAGNTLQATYEYDSKHRMTSASLPMYADYSFSYNGKDHLASVSMNGVEIASYEYDDDGKVTKQMNGTEGYHFVYDNDSRISKIYYIKPSGVESLRYQYEYDANDRLLKIKDSNNNILKQYTYDNDSNVTKVSKDNASIEYQYDNLGNVNEEKRTVCQSTINQSFDTVSRSKGCNPEAIYSVIYNQDDYLCGMFDGTTSIASKNVGTSAYDISHNKLTEPQYGKKGIVPCVYAGTANPLCYSMGTESTFLLPCDSVGFWFYPEGEFKILRCLFSTRYNKSYIAAFVGTDRKLHLEILDENGNDSASIVSDYEIELNKWNFFHLNWMNRNDGEGYPDVCEYILTLNAHHQAYRKANPRINISGSSGLFHIGYFIRENRISNPLNMYITGLMIGKRTYLRMDKVLDYYRVTKDYIIENELISDDIRTVDFSSTNLHTTNQSILNQFELYPLQNSVLSLSGKRPIAFSLRNKTALDKDRTFNFNNLIKHYCYVADGEELAYNFGNTGSGTIMLRVYFDGKDDRQYILEMNDSEEIKIGLYRGDGNRLYVEASLLQFDTQIECLSGKWYTVALSYNQNSYSQSMDINTVNFRVYVKPDGGSPSVATRDMTFRFDFTDVKTSIGRRFNATDKTTSMGTYKTAYPVHGQIEMLAVRGAYCEEATLSQLAQELIDYSKIQEYDEFGMLKKVEVHKCGSSILSNTYEYKSKNDNGVEISSQIKKEKIKYGYTTVNRAYVTNAIGNVTSITDSTFGSHTYEYDYRGFLTKEDNINYTYDNNGNITKAGSDTYTYDSTIKDRLTKVNGYGVFYSTSNPLNPSSYKDKEYTFEGRRLVSVDDTSSADEDTCFKYTYNDQGLIIKKTVEHWYYDDRDSESETTNYYYDGDKLITEITPTYRNDFLYDENGLLYGFVHNSTNKYFYVRDFMQNILGIVDTNGSLVVKYKYDAYGNSKGDTDNSGIGLAWKNPFKYKGYYWDEDLDMYYCKSRFYVPEWRRWLNGDNVQYLSVGSIGCANLFAYCNNNPVMYSDGSGHFGILLTLLISTGIGALVGAGIGTGKELLKNDFDFSKVNWWNVAGAALSGAATGLAYGLGGVAGGIVKGSLATIGNLSVYQSVGFLAGAALTSNFAAGMGVYALKEAGNDQTSFNPLMMLSGGIGQMLKGGLSFAMGGMMTGSGLWKIGKGVKNTINPLIRAAAKSTAVFLPNYIIDNIFNNF